VARRRFTPLRRRLAATHPHENPDVAVAEGRVRIDGRYVSNADAMVATDAAVVVEASDPLRGEAKLGHALDRCEVPVAGTTALDVGAAAGGFTAALLDREARRVYAVDAGHGQRLGSLRLDPRVVNLEATNVSRLDRTLVPDPIQVVVVDVSYLPLRDAVRQATERVDLADGCHLVGLVKPMFELGLGHLPETDAEHQKAVADAAEGIAGAGWHVERTFRSDVLGARGAIEHFVHATWPGPRLP
jgi:23S rRNA (cytidine1920-2'-O)/16S rRNA (cytidine1409-2'-O)-methyltransferase